MLDIPKPVRVTNGQPYWRIGGSSYTRKDGSPGILDRWTSFCAACGASFECMALPGDRWLTRRCEAHKRPGVRVGSKADRNRRDADRIEAESLMR